MPMDSELSDWIDLLIRKDAADLILTAGRAPLLRVVTELVPIGEEPLAPDRIRRCVEELLNEKQAKELERHMEVDFSFGIPGSARFRGNAFWQQGCVGLVLRRLPAEVPALEPLGVPEKIKDWLTIPHGIIITTGPTGSGKSTSQAAMIRYLNERKSYHVVTIEDPIEYTHVHNRCTIEQREVGRDTASFASALKSVFRQSPDVIMVGEMRDRETIEAALQLAETGHLVLGTLHTGDSMQAISRMVDIFPPEQHQQVRVQLSLTLIGVLVQQLLPSVRGEKRILAAEVLEATAAVRNLIRRNELEQIYSVLQTSTQNGMTTMNASLVRLFQEGKISMEDAMLYTSRPKELGELISRKTRVAVPSSIRTPVRT